MPSTAIAKRANPYWYITLSLTAGVKPQVGLLLRTEAPSMMLNIIDCSSPSSCYRTCPIYKKKMDQALVLHQWNPFAHRLTKPSKHHRYYSQVPNIMTRLMPHMFSTLSGECVLILSAILPCPVSLQASKCTATGKYSSHQQRSAISNLASYNFTASTCTRH